MSDYKLPELPSDDELGITDEDRAKYEKDLPDEAPDKELAALIGEAPGPGKSPKEDGGHTGGAEEARKAKAAGRAQKKAEKKARREEKRQARKAAKAGVSASTGNSPDDGPTGGPKDDPAESTPRSRWRGPLTLAALLTVSFVSSTRTGLPRPGPTNAPDTAFSSARAMSTLVEIARKAHPTGSPEHTRVREFLLDRLTALGLEPSVQTTTSIIQNTRFARTATVRNIVARLAGTASTGTVLITAHYDSREIAVGAADDGSGVVTIIEAVRALQADEPLRNDVIVLLTDAEELGLLGARAFVAEHPWMDDVSLVLSLEMRGGGGPSIMFETNQDNGWVVRALQDFDSHPFANSLAFEVYERLPNGTDFTPFKEAGVQGLNFAAIDNAHVYHQEYDRPENLSESTLQHHGIHALGALKYFGNADLGVVNGPNVVYFSVPVLGLFVYDQRWVLPLSGMLVVLFGMSVLLAVRNGARRKGIAAGLGVAAVTGALAFGAAIGLLAWIPRFHEEVDSLYGSAYHSEGWYVLALACAAFCIVTSVTTLARRWLSPVELATGAVAIPLVGAVWLSFATPLAAMNLQWPVLAGLLSAAVLALMKSRSEGVVLWIVAVVLAVPVIAMSLPVVELLWISLSIRLAGILAVLMVVTLLLCLPALGALRHPNGWWAPLTSLVLGGAALGMGLLMSRPTATRPTPTTLVYAYEHGTGSAVWATSPVGAGADAGAEGEARAWAVQRASAAFAATRDLSGFGYRAGEIPVAPAPVVSAMPPEVVLVSDTIFGGVRHAVLRVRSRIGAEMLRFEYDGAGSTRLLSIDGAAIDVPDSLLWADHWGEPEGSVELELSMPADEPIGLHIIEHLLRPEELLGDDAFTRPEHMAPDVTWMSDRAMFRYSVAAFVDPRHAIALPGAGAIGARAGELADGTGALGDGSSASGDSANTSITGDAVDVDSLRATGDTLGGVDTLDIVMKPGPPAGPGSTGDAAKFDLSASATYLRAEIVDSGGCVARTQGTFTEGH